MNILQGLIPSDAARARLPRHPILVPREAVIAVPKVAAPSKRERALAYLRLHPMATRYDVAAACDVKATTADVALRELKREGVIAPGKRRLMPTIEDRILTALRECNTGAPAELMKRLNVSANTLYGALQRLKEQGRLSCEVTYTWTVHA